MVALPIAAGCIESRVDPKPRIRRLFDIDL
jgi:hypothetical protein